MIGVFFSVAMLVIVGRFYDWDHDRLVGFLAIWSAGMVIRLQWRVDRLEGRLRRDSKDPVRIVDSSRFDKSDRRSA